MTNKRTNNKSDNDTVKIGLIDKLKIFFKKKSNKVNSKKNKIRKNTRSKKKRFVNGRFTVDILDLLIIIVVTVIISSVFTGFILNFQYRETFSYLKNNKVSSEDINGFIEIYTEVVDNFYEEVDQKGMIDAALDGMLEYLEDNYSIHLNKEQTDELSQSLDGTYQGIGVLVYGNVVNKVYDNSPAFEAGIKVNDEIVGINDFEVTMNNFDEATSHLSNDEDNIIKVKRDDKVLSFSIKVGEVYLPSTSEEIIISKDKRIGYISLSTFSANSSADFQESLIRLNSDEGIDSLIIDLRGNTGGYLSSASNIANIFLKKGQVIYSLDNKDGKSTYKDDTNESMDIDVVVLINQVSASASEVLASALKDSYGATLVGMTSFGKGTVQTTKKYGDTIVKYTSAKWLRPNGECVDGIGITPDYEVEVKIKDNVVYDKQLDKAIELLN